MLCNGNITRAELEIEIMPGLLVKPSSLGTPLTTTGFRKVAEVEVAELETAIAGTSKMLVIRVGMVVVVAMAKGKVVLLPALLATFPINRSNPTFHKGGASSATSLDSGARSARRSLYQHLLKSRQGRMQPWMIYIATMLRFLA